MGSNAIYSNNKYSHKTLFVAGIIGLSPLGALGFHDFIVKKYFPGIIHFMLCVLAAILIRPTYGFASIGIFLISSLASIIEATNIFEEAFYSRSLSTNGAHKRRQPLDLVTASQSAILKSTTTTTVFTAVVDIISIVAMLILFAQLSFEGKTTNSPAAGWVLFIAFYAILVPVYVTMVIIQIAMIVRSRRLTIRKQKMLLICYNVLAIILPPVLFFALVFLLPKII